VVVAAEVVEHPLGRRRVRAQRCGHRPHDPFQGQPTPDAFTPWVPGLADRFKVLQGGIVSAVSHGAHVHVRAASPRRTVRMLGKDLSRQRRHFRRPLPLDTEVGCLALDRRYVACAVPVVDKQSKSRVGLLGTKQLLPQ